jgi:3-hydroxybutyryl-CoA dehydrogenase
VSRTLHTVAIIGAGTMGHGIAQVAAMAGHTTRLMDASMELAERGLSRVRENLEGGLARGKLTAEQRDATLARIVAGADLSAAVHDATLVIEAVPERMDLKTDVLRAIETAAPATAILASNTSSLSITKLQDALERPRRMLGLHFFNPVHINPLVEVVKGRRTVQETLDLGLAFVRGLGKEPIVVNDSPGFATSRLGVLLGLEAIRMLEEGVASAEDIDKAMELGYRHPMGPLRLTDLVGLDVRLDIANYLYETLGGKRFKPPRLLRDMVKQGKLGRKSGQGFYRWTDGG